MKKTAKLLLSTVMALTVLGGSSLLPATASAVSTTLSPNTGIKAANPDNETTDVPGFNRRFISVYAKTSINTYWTPVFHKKEIISHHAAKSHVYAHVFYIDKLVRNKNGVLRYKLANGGYITANPANVSNAIWEGTNYKTMYVTSPKGIYQYHSISAHGDNDRVKFHPQGSALKVVGLSKDDIPSYQLADGDYIIDSKTTISPNKPKTPAKVKATGSINVYSDVNLKHRVKHYSAKAKHTFAVKGFDYSNGDIISKGNTLRYKVAGGYISGNKKLVKPVK